MTFDAFLDRRRRARAQAARWLTRMGRGLTPARQRALEAWLADTLHAEEFSELRAILDVAAELKGPARAALAASAAEAPRRARLDGRALWLVGVTATAVLVVVAAGGLWLWGRGYLPRTYGTRVGQIRSVVLPDGSVAYLNTNTRLRWIGSPDNRKVRLLRGEVFFEVVHDPARPFRILLAHSEVQVLGTRFDVYRKTDGDVLVTVVSGMVSVEGLSGGARTPSWIRRLTTNQQIEYSPVGLIADVHPARALNVIRWRQGIIETRGEPLSAFVSDLSRYTAQRIVIADPRAARMQIGGAFSVRNVGATLDRIARIEPLTVTHEDGAFVLGYRATDRQGGASPNEPMGSDRRFGP